MPFKSQKQREWMHANRPEMAEEWERHTPAGPLPERVAKQRESTRASGRKKGLARLTRMAGLGVMVVAWFLFGGCGAGLTPAETAAASDDAVVCVNHQIQAVRAEKISGGDCRSAVATLGIILATDKACERADIREATYVCPEGDGGRDGYHD